MEAACLKGGLVPLASCPQAAAVSDHYPIELRLQGIGSANAAGKSGAAGTVLLSIAGVMSVAMATTSLLI